MPETYVKPGLPLPPEPERPEPAPYVKPGLPPPPRLRMVEEGEPAPPRPAALRVRGASKAIGRVTAAWQKEFAKVSGGRAALARLQSGLRAYVRAASEERGFDLDETLRRFRAGPMQRALSYEAEKERLKQRMWRLARRYETGKIGKGELRRAWRDLLEDGYASAVRIGKARARGRSTRGLALNAADWREIRSYLQSEFRYLDGFLDHLQRMKREKRRFTSAVLNRVGIYVSGLNAAENEAFMRYLPAAAGDRVWWRLSPAEHCTGPSSTGADVAPGGCVGLARGGPYTRETLPTMPGAGDTACLHNCRCYLEVAPTSGHARE